MSQGELVTETFAYDGGRRVTVYLPPDPAEAIVFAGDGQVVASWGEDLASTVVVGVHRAADERTRLHEYSPALEPERFVSHEAFLMRDVRRWVEADLGVVLPAERTAALGVSAGGELALALGLRHPDVFGSVLCVSPGAGYQPPEALPARLPRTYLVAGRQEPFFLENASRWATALRDAGADVVMEQREGTHGGAFWRRELPSMVAWAFGG